MDKAKKERGLSFHSDWELKGLALIELGSHSSPFEVTSKIGDARGFEVGSRLILVSLEEWIS